MANVHGHETGIAEYIIGAMIALTRSFGRLDTKLRDGQWESQWAVRTAAPQLWPELAGKTLGILGLVTSAKRSPGAHVLLKCRFVPYDNKPNRKCLVE